MAATKKVSARIPTKGYRVDGPGGRAWLICDFGDEMTVHDGPDLLDRVVAAVRIEICWRLTNEERWAHVQGAASAIHTAKMLEEWGMAGDPEFRQLWRPGGV